MYIVFTLLLDGPIGASLWDGSNSCLDKRGLNTHLIVLRRSILTNNVSIPIVLITRNPMGVLFLGENVYFLLFLHLS